MKWPTCTIVPIIVGLAALSSAIRAQNTVTVNPREYTGAFRNPMMGLSGGRSKPYGTTNLNYIPWNELEDNASDGVQKIKDWSNDKWGNHPDNFQWVYPRVYLDYPNRPSGWPSDMTDGDYTSEQFKDRVAKFIRKLGEAWDDDPRVAWIEIGIIGRWGEHHSPSPTSEVQKIMGDAFVAAFKNKKVLNRYPRNFTSYPFGLYWDSWAHPREESAATGIEGQVDRWKTNIYEGQVAYNWGGVEEYVGASPTENMTTARYYNRVINYTRRCHGTLLSWISNYSVNSSTELGARLVQRSCGYWFVIPDVRYPSRVDPGSQLSVTFKVKNVGSAPFYYKWPVELSLLDPATKQPVWRGQFQDVDIRTWICGDKWVYNKDDPTVLGTHYSVPAPEITVQGTFAVPSSLTTGEYILALAIVNPAGGRPAVKFAITNYFNGGRHPIGRIGIGTDVSNPVLDNSVFDDPYSDRSLRYEMVRDPGDTTDPVIEPTPDLPPVVTFTKPQDNASLAGDVAYGTIQVTAHDPDAGTANGSGIERVLFQLLRDGAVVESHTENDAPYEWGFDASRLGSGLHTVRAIALATQAAGGGADTAEIAVTIESSTVVTGGLSSRATPVGTYRLVDMRGRTVPVKALPGVRSNQRFPRGVYIVEQYSGETVTHRSKTVRGLGRNGTRPQ